MSFRSKKSRKRWEYGHHPGHRGDRTVSSVSEVSMTSTIHSTLSPETRETVLKLKKIPNPFNPDMQNIFDDFITHVEESSHETINLNESSLLLSGVTKIFTAQVNDLQKSIMELAEFVTQKNKKPKEKKEVEGEFNGEPKNKEGTPGESLDQKNDKATCSEVHDSDQIIEPPNGGPNAEIPTSENPTDVPAAGEVVEFCSTDCTNDSLTDGCDKLQSNTPVENSSIENSTPSTEGGNNVLEEVPDDIEIIDLEKSLVDEVLCKPLSESSMKARIVLEAGPVTRKRLICFKELLSSKDESVRKKDSFEIIMPPKLVAYYEEMEYRTFAGDENPPELEVELPPPKKRKRKALVVEEPIEECLPEMKPEETFEGVVIKIEPEEMPTEEEESKVEANEEMSPENIDQTVSNKTIPDFAPEDQVSILECINELHYLPFTFELSNKDLSIAFSKTVDKICSIFQKYNVPLSRDMIKAASAMCSGMVPKGGNPVNGVHATLNKLNGIHETLLKSFGGVSAEKSAHETPAVASESPTEPIPVTPEVTETSKKSHKTVLELTPEKTLAHSREKIKSMIEEMQRTIVPKYARIPMMEENTPEFFQRVTNFEKKMRKVLDAEATKEEFDVRKYEKEVLEVTTKETLEQEKLEDEIQVPLSPILNTVLDQPSDDESNNDLELNFQGCSSSRSSFEGSRTSSNCGSKWVPLSHIFRHMKKLEKVEACRLFYAVLALLSYQNLDINYDQLYSEESARLTDRAFDPEKDGKYPRGVKIMTSRCPDVDKEEVYIAALTSKSRTEEFRQFLVEESRNLMKNDNKGTERSLVNGDAHYGIQEEKESFVEEVGHDYVGQLYGKRGRRPAKAAPIEFIPLPLRR